MDSIPPTCNFFDTVFYGAGVHTGAFYATIGSITAVCLYLIFSFSYFEYALYSLGRSQLSQIASSKSDEYKSLKMLLKKPTATLSAIVCGYYTSLIVFMLLCCSTVSAILSHTSTPIWLYLPIEGVVTIAAIMFFGDELPNRLNTKKLNPLYSMSGIMRLQILPFKPTGYALNKFTCIIDKRYEVKSEHKISIDELTETLDTEAVQNNEEKEILKGIVSFGNISVDEIMRPRVDIVDVDITSSYDKVLSIIQDSEYSRLPVYEETIDDVKGILYVKDLLPYINEGKDFVWQKLIREPYFVPESKKIDELLKEFQSKRIHMAIVVDEFGGTSGIVTLENILEEIVGDIVDEHDDEQKMYTKLDKRNFLLDAKLPLTDFYRIEEIDKDVFADIDTDADTIAGLLLELKGDIPHQGDKIDIKGYTFQIVSADKRRIKKVKMQLPEKE